MIWNIKADSNINKYLKNRKWHFRKKKHESDLQILGNLSQLQLIINF